MPPDRSTTVLHWRDFVCPFCYLGQTRTAILRRQGWQVIELPFPIHPEIPEGGIEVGPRTAPFHRALEAEAAAERIPLHWPMRLPNTRFALTVAELVRRTQSDVFADLDQRCFAAHFVEGRDLGDHATVWSLVEEAGGRPEPLRKALNLGDGAADLAASIDTAVAAGVTGTPAWLLPDRLIVGLQPASAFTGLLPARD